MRETLPAEHSKNQFRALQQFFRWLADEEDLPDPMAGLRAPRVTEKLVPVFTSGELSALEKTCQGRSFSSVVMFLDPLLKLQRAQSAWPFKRTVRPDFENGTR